MAFLVKVDQYSSPTLERDILINKLLEISGIDPIECKRLVPNINYIISLDDNHLKTFSDVPHPDRFWTDGQVRTWRRIEYESESIYPKPKYCWNY